LQCAADFLINLLIELLLFYSSLFTLIKLLLTLLVLNLNFVKEMSCIFVNFVMHYTAKLLSPSCWLALTSFAF